MSDRTTVMYDYDGTYNGFLSCVFESFAEKETPAAILPVDEADQTCLFGAKYIETDLRRAERVRVSIPKKMGMEAQDRSCSRARHHPAACRYRARLLDEKRPHLQR